MICQRILLGAVAGLLAGGFVMPSTLAMPEKQVVTQTSLTDSLRQKNQQTIRTYFELLSQKRMPEWLALWAEEGIQDMPYSPAGFPKRVEGKVAIAQHYSKLPTSVGRMVFPDLEIYPTTDPNTFFVEFRGEIEVLATQKPYNNRYAGLFKLREGKVVLFREYYDPIVFMEAWGNPSGFTQRH